MHSYPIHESRNLKQARPNGQYVDLLRFILQTFPVCATLATPSWAFNLERIAHPMHAVNFLC